MFPGMIVLLKEDAHIGHGAIIHGATIGRNCLVGMNAVVMDRVVVGDECIIGALSFVPADTVIPSRSVFAGNPGRIVKQVSDEMIEWKSEGTKIYQQLPADCFQSLRACEPLRDVEPGRQNQSGDYKTWNETGH